MSSTQTPPWTPDEVEILHIQVLRRAYLSMGVTPTDLIDVLFQTPAPIFEESLYRARIIRFSDGACFLQGYASEAGRLFDALYYRRLPSGLAWSRWAEQLARDVDELGTVTDEMLLAA